jgi:hypothetical protein
MSLSKTFYSGNKIRLLVVGDSIPAHTRVALSNGDYSKYATPLIDCERIINDGLVTVQGISGGNLTDHSEKIIDIIITHKPQGILLMIAGNDIDNALAKYKDVNTAVDLVKARLIAFVMDIHKHEQVIFTHYSHFLSYFSHPVSYLRRFHYITYNIVFIYQ